MMFTLYQCHGFPFTIGSPQRARRTTTKNGPWLFRPNHESSVISVVNGWLICIAMASILYHDFLALAMVSPAIRTIDSNHGNCSAAPGLLRASMACALHVAVCLARAGILPDGEAAVPPVMGLLGLYRDSSCERPLWDFSFPRKNEAALYKNSKTVHKDR
jgi:hypothetical protein